MFTFKEAGETVALWNLPTEKTRRREMVVGSVVGSFLACLLATVIFTRFIQNN